MRNLAIVVALVAAALWWGGRVMRQDTEADVRERDAIQRADTVYRDSVAHHTKWRSRYDSLRVDVTLHDPVTIAPLIEAADSTIAACDAVVSACEARVAVRDQRIRTLERRNAAWLVLYGDMGVRAPIPTFRGLTVDGEAGVALRLDRQTQLQAGATTRGDLRISVRRQVTLF